MDWAGWALFGLLATTVLTAVMIAAQLGGLTRLDLPLILGTVVTPDPDRARVAGFFIHLVVGQAFALGYAACFALLGQATWWLGGLLGAAARRRRPDGARPAARRRPSADGVEPRRTRIHRGAGTARAARPQLRRPDPARRHRRPPRLRHRPGPAARRPLTPGDAAPTRHARRRTIARPSTPTSRSRTTGCSATPAPPRWSPPTAPSTGCASPASTAQPVFGRLVGGPAAGTLPARPRPPRDRRRRRRYRPDTATLETTWEPTTGRLTLTEGMVAEVAGRLLPVHAAGATADRRGRPGRGRHRVRPPPRRAAPPAPRPQHRGRVLVCSWSTHGHRAAARPRASRSSPGSPPRSPSPRTDPLTCVLAVADREPLVYVDPDAAWDALEADELRWRAWCRDIDHDASLPRRRGPQPADPAAADLLAVGRAGRRAHHLAARGPRRDPQLGLPLRLAPRRQHRHRRLPRRRQARRGPRASWPGCSTPAASTGPACPCCSPCTASTQPPNASSTDWPGYADSAPVRVGNGAADQHQLDGYGWVLDAAWLLTQAGHRLYSETWRAMRGFADKVASRWREPDAGIWEVRGRHRPPRALQADGLARPGPRTAHRRHHRTSARRHAPVDSSASGARARRSPTRGFDPDERHLHPQLRLPRPRRRPAGPAACSASSRPTRRGSGAPSTPSSATSTPAARCSTATRPDTTAFPAPRAPSCPARSGSSRRSPAPDGPPKPTTLFDATSSRWPARSGSTPRRWTRSPDHHLGNYPQALTHAALVQAALALRDAGLK